MRKHIKCLAQEPGVWQELSKYHLFLDALLGHWAVVREEEGENYCALPCTNRLSIYVILVNNRYYEFFQIGLTIRNTLPG